MVTLFSAPKAFNGHIATIQLNAIRSWLALSPTPEVILFGNDDSIIDATRDLDIEVLAVKTNAQGTPLVPDILSQAAERARHDVLGFINADIILSPAIWTGIDIVAQRFDRFLALAERVDAPIEEILSFPEAWTYLSGPAFASRATAHSTGAMDLFVYRRGLFEDVPPFALGRTAYDGWLVWKAAQEGAALVDMSPFAPLIHQSHDYSHGGGFMAVWEGTEARANQRLLGHWSHYYTVRHASWMLASDGTTVPARSLTYRLARPKRLLSHWLRFTRGLRHRWTQARRVGGG